MQIHQFFLPTNSEQDFVYKISRFHQCLSKLWIGFECFHMFCRVQGPEADPASLPGCLKLGRCGHQEG